MFLFTNSYYRQKLNYWPNRGVPRGPFPFPIVNNFFEMLWKGQPQAEMDWYKKYGKIYGFYQNTGPSLTILDHELIKQVLVKDFSYFVNRQKLLSAHPVWSRNLFTMEGKGCFCHKKNNFKLITFNN